MSPPERRDEAVFCARLREGAERLGVAVDDALSARLWAYQSLLAHWNRTHRLVGSADAERAVEEHFLDSLSLVRVLGSPAAVGSELVDLGAGAGFPGAVLAARWPERPVALVEPLHKRVAFLNAVRAGLGLSRVRLLPVRDDALPEGSAQCIVSRAALPPPAYLRAAARLLVPGGGVVSMAARPADDALLREAEALGLERTAEDSFTLPWSGVRRVNTVWTRRSM